MLTNGRSQLCEAKAVQGAQKLLDNYSNCAAVAVHYWMLLHITD